MKISLEWLSEFVDLPDIQGLKKILQKGGFDIASHQQILGDVVADVEMPSNRPDCLGIFGIAREIAFLSGSKLKKDLWAKSSPIKVDNSISIKIQERNLCRRYFGVVINNIGITSSSQTIRNRLEQVGIKSINNIVDITNYVMYETGQPLHAFDMSKLDDQKIIVRLAKNGEKILALDDKEYLLDTGNLVIADSSKPVALAGIIGGRNSSITNDTRAVLLESAWFDPVSIRITSRRLGIKTDSSYRFEHIAIFENIEIAARRVMELIKREIPTSTAVFISDCRTLEPSSAAIKFSISDANEALGLQLKQNEISDILKKDSLDLTKQNGTSIEVKVPPYRLDLQTQQDLEEEIIRSIGLDSVKSNQTLPGFGISPNSYYNFKRTVRDLIVRLGYQEVMTLSFTEPKYAETFSHFSDKLVQVQSSLKDPKYLRSSLIPEMLNCLRHNNNIKEPLLNIFELSTIQSGDLSEKEVVCILNAIDQGGINNVLKELGNLISNKLEFCDLSLKFCVPSFSTSIKAGNETIGFAGLISSLVLDKCNLDGKKISFLELDVKALYKHILPKPRPEFSNQPSAEGDISMVVDEAVKWRDIERIVSEVINECKFICYPFDLFKGGNISAGKKSVAFRIILYPEEKIFSQENTINKVKELLKQRLNAIIR
ncbi:MAG: phenylalanine--tRNA ligase subunit beta [Planctomycetes bacterium]|nr:phenylalanine--tRNA ligase subunit beta [Planctomycetota bacterium]